MNVLEMRNQRAGLIAQARALLNKADVEKRSVSAEEDAAYNAIWADIEKLEAEISRREKQEAAERALNESTGTLAGGREAPIENRGKSGVRDSEEYRKAFDLTLRSGSTAHFTAEMRALQADSDTAGGYLLTPQQVVNSIIKKMDDEVFMRRLATVYQVPSADSLGVPSVEANPADADWTGEITTVSEDNSMNLGKRELHPHMLTKLIKISMKLLNRVPSAEALVVNRLAYKFGITMEKAYLTGTGANQPLGVFTASASGISTGRDVSTDNTTTAITADGLINCKFTLKGQYWRNAAWIFHRDAVKMIAKLKDGEGRYLFDTDSNQLLGFPMNMSEYAPNTFTTGLYVGILGDFSNYWIADAMDMTLQRLVELYAGNNQVGLIGRLSSDGMPVLEEAFARVKLA